MSEATVVTSDNLNEYNAKMLRLEPEPKKEEKIEKVETKAEEKEDHEDVEIEEESPEEKKKNKLSKRMQELANQRREAIERAERAEKRLEEIEKSREEAKPVEKKGKDKPQANQFKDAFEYAEALALWTVERREAEREAERVETELKKAEETRQKNWMKRQEAYAKEVADYKEVMASIPDSVQLHQVVLDAIQDSDTGPQVLYHLALNPEIAESWHDLSPVMALRALGKLEAQLEKVKDPEKEKVIEKKEVSKAPAPINPVEGKTTPDNLVTADGEFKGTYAQFKALRESGKIK